MERRAACARALGWQPARAADVVVTNCGSAAQLRSLVVSGNRVTFNCGGTGAPATIAVNAGGGFTVTAGTSIAIDGGEPTGCTGSTGAPLPTDQRSKTRPVDGDANGTAVCDIGAVERRSADYDFHLFLPMLRR